MLRMKYTLKGKGEGDSITSKGSQTKCPTSGCQSNPNSFSFWANSKVFSEMGRGRYFNFSIRFFFINLSIPGNCINEVSGLLVSFILKQKIGTDILNFSHDSRKKAIC